jgi:hypothetical protein
MLNHLRAKFFLDLRLNRFRDTDESAQIAASAAPAKT